MHGSERRTVSFVVRLSKEPRESDQPELDVAWRGFVQHVQSGQETRFINLQDLMEFIQTAMKRAEVAPLAPPTAPQAGRRVGPPA